jgi:hypothetical protein
MQYGRSLGPGAEVIHENWMMDNFNVIPTVVCYDTDCREWAADYGGVSKEESDELRLTAMKSIL